MSNSELEIKWLNFVRRLRVVGVLLIFVIIPFLAFIMIPIHFIFTMIAVGDITKLNRKLNSPYIQTFRSKYIAASILKLIGSIIVHAGSVLVAFAYFGYAVFDPIYIGYFPYNTPPAIFICIIGFIFMIVGSAVEIGAWENLKLFVYHNRDIFDERVHSETMLKIDNLRSGAVLWTLGFLVVTILIGWITQLIGYFGLSNAAERSMKAEPIKPQAQVYQAPPPPAPPTPPTPPSPPKQSVQKPQVASDIVFCPMCGAKVSQGAIFCGECGVKLVE
ncbi:MAG: zinc ribbon domain-containing protein [Candidatus Hermodarchaeota archaeon]